MNNLDNNLSRYMADCHSELSGTLRMSDIVSYMHLKESKEGLPLLFSDSQGKLTPHQLFCVIIAADALSIEGKLPQLFRRLLSSLDGLDAAHIAEELHISAEHVSDKELERLGWAVKS